MSVESAAISPTTGTAPMRNAHRHGCARLALRLSFVARGGRTR